MINIMDPNGEVHSPSHLVEEIYHYLNPYLQCYEHIDLYEPGIGPGIFNQLYAFKEKTTYYGCEINPKYQHDSPIVHGDFFDQDLTYYDVILGNLPFNQGIVHTPCNKVLKQKSKTIWPLMLKKCIQHLKPNGYGAFIIPCIWLKPDKEQIYELLTSKNILYLKMFDCKESNQLFSYQCQTPICYVIFQNCPGNIRIIEHNKLIHFSLKKNYCIPTKNICLVQASFDFVQHHKSLEVIKVANTKKRNETNDVNDCFNITSLILPNEIKGFYSKTPGSYYEVPKIILAHKRLPIPYKDISGQYGLYGRDIYIVTGEQLNIVYDFLCEPIVQTIIKSFNIRMNFYEKHIFDYIPDPRYCDVESYLSKLKHLSQ